MTLGERLIQLKGTTPRSEMVAASGVSDYYMKKYLEDTHLKPSLFHIQDKEDTN